MDLINKMYIDKELIQDLLYQIIGQFNEKNYTSKILFNSFKQNKSAL